MNRKQRRMLDKQLDKLNKDEKFEMLTTMQQVATTKALNDVTPSLILAGRDETYIHLYQKFLDGYNEKTTEEQKDCLEKLISKIGVNYLKAMQKRVAEKERVKRVNKEIESGE